MARKGRRAALAPWLDQLESRALLSTAGQGSVDRLLVGFAGGTPGWSGQLALRTLHAHVVQSFAGGPSVVQLAPGSDPGAALQVLRSAYAVRYAEPDTLIHEDVIPNNPQFNRQWGLSNPNGIDISAPAAWDVTTGTPATIVAVIDSGIDLGNPAFAGRIWTNPNPAADRGFPGDVHGWNFLTGTGNVQDTDGHGTHVSGVIAAAGNDGIGVAGVDWGARIMPLKFIGADGNGSIDDAVAAIYFAVSHGAKVINASWGGNDFSQALDDAIRFAGQSGVVFVTAAGNDSTNNDQIQSYPASDRLPNTISVAAVDQNGNLASFSNYGPSTVDIAAPGVDIRSTIPGGFATYSGTSMATPFVTGVVALVAGLHPQESAAQLVHQVVGTAKPLPSLTGKIASGGMVDAYRALTLSPTGVAANGTPAPAGVTGDDIRATILASDEYYAEHGGSRVGYVSGLYRDLLGRPADPAGLSIWVSQLQAGASRGDVARTILTSPEGRRTLVAGWFLSDLKRPGSLDSLKSDPTVTVWGDDIVKGINPDDIRATILGSDEYYAVHGGSVAGLVDSDYRELLGRPSDPTGLAVWASQLLSGTSRSDVARAIFASPEGRRSQIAQWFVSDLHRADALESLKSNSAIVVWAGMIG